MPQRLRPWPRVQLPPGATIEPRNYAPNLLLSLPFVLVTIFDVA
jgi:hypothetical protein